jgi:hypothetical protein
MARYLIYEDVRETRKYVIEAEDYESAVDAWVKVQEAGDIGSFVDASTISYEVQQIDDAGSVVELFPAVET